MNPTYQHYATHDESEFPHLWEGVVGAWAPCLGPSGTRLHDHSGRANWGTLTNMDAATDWVVDGGQYALDFDGTNDLVELGAFDLLRQPLSIFAWALRRSSGVNHTIIDGATNASNSFGAHIRFTTGDKIRWYFNNATAGFIDTITTPATGIWHHVAGTFDGTNSKIFLNGVLENSRTGDSFGTAVGNYRIGCLSAVYGANAGVMNGLIAEVCISRRALHANEIRELWEIGRGGMYTPRRRRRAYSYRPSLRRRLILTGQT